MVVAVDSGSSFAADLKNLDALKLTARRDPAAGNKAVAQQFEAMFMQMVLKAMRDAMPEGGLTDSNSTKLYTSLLDQQLAQNLSSRGGIGLARSIEQQLNRALNAVDPGSLSGEAGADIGLPANTALSANARVALRMGEGSSGRIESALAAYARGARPAGKSAPASAVSGAVEGEGAVSADSPFDTTNMPAHVREFITRLWPHAVEASRTTGVPPQFMLAQAALETGWGRAEPRDAAGRPTHNLFGIKAGRSWSGAVLESPTTEFEDGNLQRVTARFRAYGSYAESFRDYAGLLSSSPRYAGVLGQQDANAFGRALQQAGYATDPAYADKLARIIKGSFPLAQAPGA